MAYTKVGWKNGASGGTPISAANLEHMDAQILQNANDIATLNNNIMHNIPRIAPKDITQYYTDGSLWKRLNGTDGYSLFQDIYVGDYIKMSRSISAKNPDTSQQAIGSQYVTIASIDGLMRNGDNVDINYHHLVMIPGQGYGGTQHFGRSRMNQTNTTASGYKASEMNTTKAAIDELDTNKLSASCSLVLIITQMVAYCMAGILDHAKQQAFLMFQI